MRTFVTCIAAFGFLLVSSMAWSAQNAPKTGQGTAKTGEKHRSASLEADPTGKAKAREKRARAEKRELLKLQQRLLKANEVFTAMMKAPDKGIPTDLLRKARCVVVIPSVKKIAIGAFGGRHGAGIGTCRRNNGAGPWGAPSAFSISGGSFGLQIGYSNTDYVLLFMNKDSLDRLLEDKFTVGADASATAGPVGRTTAAETDAQLHAEILTYSRSQGIFAGVSLQGAVLRATADDNRILYGRTITARELLLVGDVRPPAQARPLLATLNRFLPSMR